MQFCKATVKIYTVLFVLINDTCKNSSNYVQKQSSINLLLILCLSLKYVYTKKL